MVDFTKLTQKLQNHKPEVPIHSAYDKNFLDQRNLSYQISHNQQLGQEFAEKSLNDEQTNLLRLQYDFEFIQHLVSPDYIRYLFRNQYHKKQEFLNYLQYLKYFEQPEYFKLLVNPKCIDALNLLLREEIRLELERNNEFSNYFQY